MAGKCIHIHCKIVEGVGNCGNDIERHMLYRGQRAAIVGLEHIKTNIVKEHEMPYIVSGM